MGVPPNHPNFHGIFPDKLINQPFWGIYFRKPPFRALMGFGEANLLGQLANSGASHSPGPSSSIRGTAA